MFRKLEERFTPAGPETPQRWVKLEVARTRGRGTFRVSEWVGVPFSPEATFRVLWTGKDPEEGRRVLEDLC